MSWTTRLGATRLVILTRRHAIKPPRPTAWHLFLSGLLANRTERIFAQTEWPELCPIRWSLPGGWLVVMPRCNEVTARSVWPSEPERTEDHLPDDLYERLVEHDDYRVPAENKLFSWGWYAGRLVAVDYGSPEAIEERMRC